MVTETRDVVFEKEDNRLVPSKDESCCPDSNPESSATTEIPEDNLTLLDCGEYKTEGLDFERAFGS